MVTKMAKNMVTKYGMSKELGTIAYGENEEEVFLGRSVTKQQNMSVFFLLSHILYQRFF